MTTNPKLPTKRSASLLIALCLAVLVPEVAHADDPGRRVIYAGRLEDGQGRPVGGVFPLTFAFHKTEKGGKAAWTEAHFVAVDNGVYAVELGRLKNLPKNLDLTKAWISVAITGGKEVVRDRFAGDVIEAPAAAPVIPVAPPPGPSVGVAPQPAKGTYADLAGFAYEAEKAKAADTIGGMTANDLRNLAKQAQAATTAAPAKAKIGQASRFTDAAGGPGGSEFTLQCPPGHVATGIRGRGAVMIDQISVICSPLE
jgi:hypothetical protein